jgi:iron complex outermembrane receptor protein
MELFRAGKSLWKPCAQTELELVSNACFFWRFLTSCLFCFSAAASAQVPVPLGPAVACTSAGSAARVAIRVRVTDLSGAALVQAAVEARCGNDSTTAITDNKGVGQLNLLPGRYEVITRSPGFADNVREIDLPDAADPLVVTMSVGAVNDFVNVSGDMGFVPYASNAGSKTDALLIEVPQSISIINELEMQSRGVTTVNEALRYTPGITADEYGVEPRFDWLKIRGFDAQTFGIYRDGMRFNSLSGKLDPFELESVEVLRGPSSVLYGEVPPGGLINQVTKRPSAERSTTVSGVFGSYARRQGQFDTTGAFDHAGVYQYRLLGLIRNAGTQTNFTPDDRRLIAPAFTWRPGERTNVTLLGDYQHDRTQWSQFLPAQGTLTANPNGVIPVSTFVGEPGSDSVKRNQGSAAYTADHLFTDGWDVHSNYRYQYIHFKGQTIYGAGFDGASLTNVSRYLFATPNINRINTVDTRALRHFNTGSRLEQTVLFGYDFQRLDQRATTYFLFGLSDINIYHPVYGQTPIPTGPPSVNNDSILDQHGLYAQDQIKIDHRLIFTLGGRQDFARNAIADFITPTNSSSRLDEKFTGRAGVTYLTNNGIAPYFAYSTSFLPNAGIMVYDAATKLPDLPAVPSLARQSEGGVKFQPRNASSFITASVFQINQTNVLVYNSAFTEYQAGEVRSRGVELEGLASVARGLNLHAGYTHDATETLVAANLPNDSSQASVGTWLPQTPRNTLTALADYSLSQGRLRGVGGNFGVRFTGTNAADAANTFFIPNYALLDASLRFGYRHTLFQINATNLTDKRYVATCTSTAACYYGYARNVLGTATYHF